MPSSGWLLFRTVVEEPAAHESIDQLSSTFERFAEVWEGFKWLVARSPEEIGRYHDRGGTRYWLSHRRGHRGYSIPDLAVLYTFDEHEVVIHAVMAWEAESAN